MLVNEFPIVGIGASAGGLEAVTLLLKHLPAAPGMAFVVVQHLDPQHESALTTLLSRVTTMVVREAKDGMLLERDHVYVIPPNKKMGVAKRSLWLLPREKAGDLNAPIDYFFRTLATDQGEHAIGIVLSGTGTDGTRGLAQIKAADGITFVQSEESAKYAGMPHSAAASGFADRVLPPEQIAGEIVRTVRHSSLRPLRRIDADGPLLEGDEFKQICDLLGAHCGVDFSHYKPATLRRRIGRRLVLQKAGTLKEYVACLRKSPAEVEALFQDILICVTEFFRDPKMFELLKKKIFPKILKNRQPDAPIRLWVAGCSSGEEAYSLVIALLEFLEKEGVRCPIQLFGTDINETVIKRARAGLYPERIKDEVSPDRLRRFFTKSDGGYRVNKTVRDQCMFALQNVIEDPPFSHVDLITCRNVLIYFDAALQKKVIPVLHYALRPHGFLVLGTAESVSGFEELFAVADAKFRIYEKKHALIRPVGAPSRFTARKEPLAGSHLPIISESVPPLAGDIRKQADAIVLSQFAPAGVVVNSGMDILQFRGRTGPYLENAPGEPTLNLFKLARQGLAVDLRSLLTRAAKQKRTVGKDGLQVRHEGRILTVNVKVVPLLLPNVSDPFFLVLFEERAFAVLPLSRNREKTGAAVQRELEQLRDELAATKLSLQNIIEEQDAANEELRAANEEILSSNEELQSTNEEMETTAEELQSTNEELVTLNDELQSRNVEMQVLGDDMANLFASIDIPIIMLSNDLRIRRFTPRAVKVLNLISGDIGRPISDFNIKLNLPNLQELITDVLDTLSVIGQDVQDMEGRWHSLRIRPYKTSDNRIDGVVLTLQDIDALKRALAEAETARAYAEAIIATVREPLLILNGNLRVKTANRSFYSFFGAKPQETEGRPIRELGNGEWAAPPLLEMLERVLPGEAIFQDLRFEQKFPQIGRKTLLLNARRLNVNAEEEPLILLAMEDVSGGKANLK